MTLLFRFLLFFTSLLSIIFFLRNIRKTRIQVDDSLFWILFAIVGIILSAFPGILNRFAGLLGIISPVNLLYLVLLFVLIIRNFSLTVKVSRLQMSLNRLGQEVAMDKDRNSKRKE